MPSSASNSYLVKNQQSNNNSPYGGIDYKADSNTQSRAVDAAEEASDTWTLAGGSEESSVVLQGYGAYNETHSRFTATGNDIASAHDGKSKGKRTKRTWDGVFMPVSVSVFGVVLFIRLPWIVGEAGLLLSLFGIALCYMASGLTTVSMAAISTNGYVGDGGPYMMISRCLGPQVGIVIGVTFVMANAVSSVMYLIGSAEIMVRIISWDSLNQWHDDDKYLVTLIISSLMLMVLLVIAFLSIEKWFRICCLVLTAISIGDIIVAMVAEKPSPDYGFSGPTNANWKNNVYPSFEGGNNFQTILATLFPGVTGVMSGVCVSGELMNSAKAIPKGIAYAWMVSLVIYTLITFLISASFDRAYLQNNFGIFNHVGHPWLFYPGEAVACFAAVLAMMGGSVRVLQAIAKDDLMRSRVIRIIGTSSLKNATLFYGLVVQLILFVGDTYQPVSLIAAQIYCLNFAALNISTFVSSVSGVVSFRPIYRFFNKSTALLGAVINIVLMFYMNPVSALCFTLATLALVVFVDFNVDTSSIPWGDASQPIVFHFVRKWLLRLDERKEHIRHWRPSIVMVNTDPLCSLNLIHLANNLKKGGLFELAFILKGDFESTSVSCFRWKGWAMDFIGASGIKAFAVVSFGQTLRAGVQSILRTCGLGGMKANTVIISLDEYLQNDTFKEVYRTYTTGNNNSERDVGMASYFNFGAASSGGSKRSNDKQSGGVGANSIVGDTTSVVSYRGLKKPTKGIDAVRTGVNYEPCDISEEERLLGGGVDTGIRYTTRVSRLEEAIEQTAMRPIVNEKIWAALQRTSVVLPRGAVEGLGTIRAPNMLTDTGVDLGSPLGHSSPSQSNFNSPTSHAAPFSTYRTRSAESNGKKLSKAIAIFRNNDNKHRDDEEHQIEKMVCQRRAAMERNAIDLAPFEDIEEFCNICADVNHVQMNLVIARNIDKLDKKAIEQSKNKVYIDLWLPDEDDAVVFLMGYSLSRTSVWQKHAVLRIVSVVKYNEEIEPQNLTMQLILKKHRLNALSHTVSLEMETTRRGVENPDQIHQLLQDESTRFELLNSIMKNETSNTAIILCRVDPYQRPKNTSNRNRDAPEMMKNAENVMHQQTAEDNEGEPPNIRGTMLPRETALDATYGNYVEESDDSDPLAKTQKNASFVAANNNLLLQTMATNVNVSQGSFCGIRSCPLPQRASNYDPLHKEDNRKSSNPVPPVQNDDNDPLALFETHMSGVGGLTRKLSALDASFIQTLRKSASEYKHSSGLSPRGTEGPSQPATAGSFVSATPKTPVSVSAYGKPLHTPNNENEPANNQQDGPSDPSSSLAKEWFASIVALSSELPPMLMIAGGPMKGLTADW